MQYTTMQGVQGICAPGWHLPTDEEWKLLEGAVDSQFGIGETIWDISGDRGYDAGTNLKTTHGWYFNGNGTDLLGFTVVPGGGRFYGNAFNYIGALGLWWTSSEFIINPGNKWHRGLGPYPEVSRSDFPKGSGLSVRCLRDWV